MGRERSLSVARGRGRREREEEDSIALRDEVTELKKVVNSITRVSNCLVNCS